MKIKRFFQYLKERFDFDISFEKAKVFSTSHTSMLEATRRFDQKECRFIIDHQDKFRFGDANRLIHWDIAVNDPSLDHNTMPMSLVIGIFKKTAKYAGYVSVRDKTYSIATSDGTYYGKTGPLSGKAKVIDEYLKSKGYTRLPDGEWPR